MKIKKAIINKTGTRLKVNRKRTYIRDHFRKQADRLPKMHAADGKPVNHYTELKKIYKAKGQEGVNEHMKACRKAIRRYVWTKRLMRIGIKLRLITVKHDTNNN